MLLDELSTPPGRPTPAGRGQIWASPDFRVVWQRHNPPQRTDDPFPDAAGWFSRQDRPTNEIKQIDNVSGNTVFFTTPIHISYRAAHNAQLTSFGYTFIQNAGSRISRSRAATTGTSASSAPPTAGRRTSTTPPGSTRALRWPHLPRRGPRLLRPRRRLAEPGGGGYAISLSNGTSEALVENYIIVKANKVMVARSAGPASVFGYNYIDDGFINSNTGWIEIGLNA